MLVSFFGCFGPTSRAYYFPQVGLYMTVTFDDGDWYAILSRDSIYTSLSEEVDYVRMHTTSDVGWLDLFINPESPEVIVVDDLWGEPCINMRKFSISMVPECYDTVYVTHEIVTHEIEQDFDSTKSKLIKSLQERLDTVFVGDSIHTFLKVKKSNPDFYGAIDDKADREKNRIRPEFLHIRIWDYNHVEVYQRNCGVSGEWQSISPILKK